MISEYLQNVFFAVDYIFGDLIDVYWASLICGGIFLAIIYHLTKR